MACACVTVRVEPESVLADRSFVSRAASRARGWTSATRRAALYGTPDAMRRLGAALLATPPAERLAAGHQHPGRQRPRESPASMRRGWRAVMAIDDLLDRARDARRRRDEAAGELVALVRALDGLEGVGMLDATQTPRARAAA